MPTRIFALMLALLVVGVGWVASCVIWRAAEVGELIAPLEARRFEKLTIIAVGTGSAYENPERLGPAMAVGWHDDVLLVDVGRGVAEALRRAKIPVHQPARILLSSLMPENTMGIDDLVFTGWLADRAAPLEVYGPPGTEDFVAGLLAAYAAGSASLGTSLALPDAGSRIVAHEIGQSWSVDWDGLAVSVAELPDGPADALAWRFEAGGRSAVIGGIGWGTDELVALATGADLLLHEAVYIPPPEDVEDAGVLADPERLRREGELHTSIMAVGDLARRAGVPKLALIRMRPPPFYDIQVTSFVRESFDGEIVVPKDGDELVP
jgi:ribonuclease BN (tRNA processing enzyme)